MVRPRGATVVLFLPIGENRMRIRSRGRYNLYKYFFASLNRHRPSGWGIREIVCYYD